MKLETDYDLFELIDGVRTGFAHKFIIRTILKYSLFPTLFSVPICVMSDEPMRELVENALFYLTMTSISGSITAFIVRNKCRETSSERLLKIANRLASIDVVVGYESLLNAYRYDKEYEMVKGESALPSILEKKYIMVPTGDEQFEEGVSLVQEHIVGSRKYALSVGEPQKVLKLARSTA